MLTTVDTVFQDFRVGSGTEQMLMDLYKLVGNSKTTFFALVDDSIQNLATFFDQFKCQSIFKIFSTHSVVEVNPRANRVTKTGPQSNSLLLFRYIFFVCSHLSFIMFF